MWHLHQFSALVDRAFDLLQGDRIVANNEQITLTSLFMHGPLRPRDLSAELDLTRGGVTNLIDRLVTLGWLRREECADDRRGIQIVLTDEGRRIVEQMGATFALVFDMSGPALVETVERARGLGWVCGDFEPIGHRNVHQALERMFSAGAVARPLWDAYRVGFGSDEPRPGIVFKILWLAARSDGARLVDIVELTVLSPSTLHDLVDRLEAQGSLRRTRVTETGRDVMVVITPQGRAQLETAIINAEAPAAEFLARLLPP